MNKHINDIMDKYKAGEITVEEANAALKEAEAGFSLHPEKNPGGGWTEAEMAEGFRPGEAKEPLPDGPDLGRHPEWAGQSILQKTKRGLFVSEFDADGYHIRSKKVEW